MRNEMLKNGKKAEKSGKTRGKRALVCGKAFAIQLPHRTSDINSYLSPALENNKTRASLNVDPIMSIIVVALFTWTIFFLLLKLIDILSDRRLSRYLRSQSISLKFAFISVHTTKLNPLLESHSRRHNILLTHWFSVGVPIAAAGLLLSLVLLSVNLIPQPSSTSPSLATAHAHFRHRPRVPFMHHASAPWWLPNPAWNLFVAADHHPFDVHPPQRTQHYPHPSRLQPRVGRVLYVPPVNLRRRLLQHLGHRHPHKRDHHAQQQHQRFLTPLIPGVTIPAGDFWYMILAISIAAVLHELGHALAAAAHHARISAVGAFFALAVPGAYVRIIGVENLPTISQLRVYCAGVWHNVVSALVALATVLLLPTFMSGAYKRGVGALVVDVPTVSPLHGHVEPGDIILRMGRFPVFDGGPSFRDAIASLINTNESVGFCVSSRVLGNMSHVTNRCCDHAFLHTYERSSRTQCFREQGQNHTTACLDPAVVSSRPTCRLTVDCQNPGKRNGLNVAQAVRAPLSGSEKRRLHLSRLSGKWTGNPEEAPVRNRERCVVPVLPDEQKLIDVRVLSARSGQVVHFFYEGFAHVLGQSVTVSSYVPRLWDQTPRWWIRVLAGADFPNMLERLLQYFSSISFGLAIINMAPVLYFDGEASSGLFVELLVRRLGLPSNKVTKARAGIIALGSGLVAMNLVKAIWSLGL